MWCVSCSDDIVAGGESILLYDLEFGWVHVRMLPDGGCVAHTTLGSPVRFTSAETCAGLHRGDHLVDGKPVAGPGSFVELDVGIDTDDDARPA